jgi:hypothetical protein
MRYLATLFLFGASLLGLTAGLHPREVGPDRDILPAVSFAQAAHKAVTDRRH